MRVVIVLFWVMAAIAQQSSRSGVVGGIVSSAGGVTVVSSIGPGVPGGAVTGSPYSAEEVTEHVQTLADGTHITQPSPKTMYYRDSLGRTRIERTFPGPPGAPEIAGPNTIEISDPINNVRYMLDPRGRTARKIVMRSGPPLPPPAAPSGTVTAGRVGVPAGVQVRYGDFAGSQRPRPEFSHESLGTQTIEGVLAEGSRTTVTYPIGAVGDDRPITSVSETWTSPELKVVVLSRNSDPRSGESTTRLTNISRVEPDPLLFQVPADYEIIDAQAPGR